MLIVGAGPTGLGAAWRLEELGRTLDLATDWLLLDQHTDVGGMASSESVDGYVWDVGGHVLFPHYRYFDDLLDELVDDWRYVVPVRGAWMWSRFVPAPVQANLAAFPADVRERVLVELAAQTHRPVTTFEHFLRMQFGDVMYDEFFLPLNLKMWATHPCQMEWAWADHRSGSTAANVPRIDATKARADAEAGRLSPAWSDDTPIRYPASGGTGRIWAALAERLPAERLRLGESLTAVRTADRRAELSSGEEISFEHLVSSVPLDRLLGMLVDRPDLQACAAAFQPAAVEVVGVGLIGSPPTSLAGVCSLYVPDLAIAFWRLTVLSNYSTGCVPPGGEHWSILCEVNSGIDRALPEGSVIDRVIDGLVELGFIRPADIDSVWHRSISHGYPVPRLGSESLVDSVQSELSELGILARGRFGGWRYQVSNQDHAFMQGLEAVDRLVCGIDEVTYPHGGSVEYEDGRRRT